MLLIRLNEEMQIKCLVPDWHNTLSILNVIILLTVHTVCFKAFIHMRCQLESNGGKAYSMARIRLVAPVLDLQIIV